MLTHKGTQTIETPRLILRRAQSGDAEPMFRNWASEPEVTKFLTWPTHENLDVSKWVLESWIGGYEKADFYQWMIVLKETGEPIGSITAVDINDQIEKAEIGYCIGKKWWHKGIMTEALKAVMEFLFTQVGVNRIEAHHDPNNPHSGNVMKKCGMQYEGTARAAARNNQGICDISQYAMIKSDWEKPRHYMEGFDPKNDAELVQEIYRRFDENTRLNKSKAARVEFLTTVEYIERYLTPGAKILDIGAGAGEYSLHFARKGYAVSAVELADSNIVAFRAKLHPDDPIDLIQGNAMDLSRFEDRTFDIVLLFGPLYHLHSESDKLRCIEEAKRVCKPGGKIFFAFISNDLVVMTMQQSRSDYLLAGDYDKETFRLYDFPFVFHTLDRCRELLQKSGIHICKEVAADGLSELLKDLINTMDDETYRQYLRYHRYICEKPECLGMSNHLLFVGEPEPAAKITNK